MSAKTLLVIILIGLTITCAGGLAAYQGQAVRAFFLIGGGSTIALIAAAAMGPPRPPAV